MTDPRFFVVPLSAVPEVQPDIFAEITEFTVRKGVAIQHETDTKGA